MYLYFLEVIHFGVLCSVLLILLLFFKMHVLNHSAFSGERQLPKVWLVSSFISIFGQAVKSRSQNIRERMNITVASSWRVSSSRDCKVAVLFEAPLICGVFSLQEFFVVSCGARLYLNPLERHYGEDLMDLQAMQSKFQALKLHGKVSCTQIKLPVGRLFVVYIRKSLQRLTKFGFSRAQGKFIRKYLRC